jgi:ubiquinone/menaquinone biosynthesis C-methylase UbiE
MIFSDAEAYDRRMGRHSRVLASVFIRFIGGIHDGDRVLDVGCGTGSLAFTIANTTRASKIVGIDISEPFIEYNRSTNADPRVTFEVADALQLSYPEASFDKSMFLLAIQFVSDPPRVVAEMRRVTRPGGIVALCSWDSTGGMEMDTIFKNAAKALDPSAEFPSDSAPPRKEGIIRALLIESGLGEVEENALTIQMNFDSFDDIHLTIFGCPFPEVRDLKAPTWLNYLMSTNRHCVINSARKSSREGQMVLLPFRPVPGQGVEK